jgi:hypothetical protein
MALISRYSVPFSVENPFRTTRPATDKIIFLSCEGNVTEEEYFACISNLFNELKTKIQFVSVAEDEVHTIAKNRTAEQNKKLGMSKPKQLLEKIEKFKLEKESVFQFSQHPDDEFWIVTDIDQNLSKDFIDDFIETLDKCDQYKYGYAISNPFFEMWLLLHHDDVKEEDKEYAVTEEHPYEKTPYYRERLRKLGVPLHGNDNKSIRAEHYNREKVFQAVKRAEELHSDRSCRYPSYYATTVYQLIYKIIDMLSEEERNKYNFFH